MPEFLLAAIDHAILRHHFPSEIIVFERIISPDHLCRISEYQTAFLNGHCTRNFFEEWDALLEKERSGRSCICAFKYLYKGGAKFVLEV